jgi:ketosteroid isomerase-like protein
MEDTMNRFWSALALALTLSLSSGSPVAAQAAPRVATTMPAGELAALDAIRKDVWVHWFTGDTAGLRRVLGPELVAISPDSRYWQGLDESIAGSVGFQSNGGKFISVTFDSTKVHQFGDVVVMFSRFAVVTDEGGTRSTMAGRATEVFVRHRGRWVHTSWHLDNTP